jgi:GNAT superfamily N-acetyltransferase
MAPWHRSESLERDVEREEPVGLLYAWWRGDPLPTLPPFPGLTLATVADERAVAAVSGIDPRSFHERLRHRHQPWLARLAGDPVGSGWVATAEAVIGELGIKLAIPPGDRYLWDFCTVPAWRGRGIYPRLLQAILRRERDAAKFWIGHDFGHTASARGIAKAGLHAVGALYHSPDGRFQLCALGAVERAAAGAALLGVPLVARAGAGAAS